MPVAWPDHVDEILAGDHAVMLVYATPANGTVLLPVSNFALRDRDAGTISAVNSSVGAYRKLERIRANPKGDGRADRRVAGSRLRPRARGGRRSAAA